MLKKIKTFSLSLILCTSAFGIAQFNKPNTNDLSVADKLIISTNSNCPVSPVTLASIDPPLW